MNESDYQHLLETSWRRKLTPVEEARLQAYLAARPERQAEWESEASLNQLLGQLPAAPLSSNFTALVLQAVDRAAAEELRQSTWLERLRALGRSPAPRLAWAAVFIVLAGFGLVQYESFRQERLADGLVRFGHAASMPGPRFLEDFDAIRGLTQASAPSDDALFAVLNQSQ